MTLTIDRVPNGSILRSPPCRYGGWGRTRDLEAGSRSTAMDRVRPPGRIAPTPVGRATLWRPDRCVDRSLPPTSAAGRYDLSRLLDG